VSRRQLAKLHDSSLTERNRSNPIKSGGVHYTPLDLSRFVAEQAVAALGSRDHVQILDPACGNGALLTAAADALGSAIPIEITGFDLDALAVIDARSRLEARLPSGAVTIEHADFIEAMLDERESTPCHRSKAQHVPLTDRFDLVVANPPYVRTQVLGTLRAQRLGASFGLTGRVDLYHAFAVAMTQAIQPGGVLALLCSNRFLTTKSGRDLRAMLAGEFDLLTIFDLGDTKAFRAAVLPALVVGRRSTAGSKSIPIVSIYERRDTEIAPVVVPSVFEALSNGTQGPVTVDSTTYEVRRGIVDASDHRNPWVPASTSLESWVATIDAATAMRFGDVGKFHVGIKTTADSVFISADWDLADPVPEPQVLLPLITHHIAHKWAVPAPSRRVLYPYDLRSSTRLALNLDLLPRTQKYLESNRTRLESRRYLLESRRQWWELWVPQRPSEWSSPKVVCPDISESARFFYDTSGAVVNGDCYWMTVHDRRLAMIMMAVGNSPLGMAYYDAVCGNRLYAGRRRFITQYVERFPIPDPSLSSVDTLVSKVESLVNGSCGTRRHAVEDDVNALVYQAFGLENIP